MPEATKSHFYLLWKKMPPILTLLNVYGCLTIYPFIDIVKITFNWGFNAGLEKKANICKASTVMTFPIISSLIIPPAMVFPMIILFLSHVIPGKFLPIFSFFYLL